VSTPILYGIFLSPFVRKTRLVLAAKGIEYEHKQLTPRNDDPDFRVASPLGKIPAWKDDHVAVSDSSVIIQYLERYYPGAKVLPEGQADFARALWFEEYADSKLVPIIGGHLFAEVVLAERFFNRKPIQSDIDMALNEEIPAVSDYLETQIAGREFLVGDSMSLADLAIGGIFAVLYHAGYSVDQERAPQLKAYVERLFTLEPFATILNGEVEGMKQINWSSSIKTA